MKKIVTMLFIGVMLVSTVAGCSKKSSKMTIGVSIANFDDTFLTYMMDGMKAYAKKLQEEGIELDVEYTDAKEDMAKQMDQVETFVVQQKDAIVVVPVDTSAADPLTQAATNAEIPIVYVNRNPGNLPEGAFYVGSEEIKAGIMQMEFLAEKLGGNGKIAILMGKLDNEGALKRTEGVEQISAKYDGIDIVDKQTGLWQRNEGMMKTEDWLNRFGDELKAIASNNDDMALGAIQALKDGGRDDILVVGVDATPDGLNALKNGELTATVFQDAAGQGGGAIELAYKAAQGDKPEQEKWIDFKLVTPENLDEFLK
ncbi:sugar ABC transporter substrate-binding protein [Vallitalea pronyensis]|uniref:Sugar ABC transporter substrate-binding protein n=1 Tax=Vallitalea pronyensis TaxID=1348613 RepID=A0A8J8MLT0_9FIRM|nr:sugar ABC transporter substrate-binding protein [Vallitalea pronyensis]QUI24030.1 sugar ABC transporter substrate-binding protein [Vallitalea pronyensis]